MNNHRHKHPIEQISFSNDHAAYVIEASAGTGKTWTIERLFIKALLERPTIQLSQILVVTFTNDATNELKTRIVNQISKTIEILITLGNNDDNNKLSDSNDIFITSFLQYRTNIDKDIALLLRCYQNFDNASIYTIHGFCHKILQDYQIECNINNPIDLVVEKTTQITELVRNFFREHIINNPNFIDNIAQAYATLDAILDSDYTTDYIQKIVAKLPKDLLIYKNGKIMPRYAVLENPDLNLLMQDITQIDNMKGTHSNKLELQEQKTIILTHLLSSVVNFIVAKYDQIEPNFNMSFNEIIEFVASSVQNDPNIASELSRQYPIAFIDEFQDTDILQWQIFCNIYNNCKRGILVVVGDPKQAIYRFRGADIDVYVEARNTINNCITLTENYRSHPHIINFINQLFSAKSGILGHGIDYIPKIARADISKIIKFESSDDCEVLRNEIITPIPFYNERVQIVTIAGKDSADKKNNVIKAITAEILHLLSMDANFLNKIAILVTKNSDANQLVAHFKKYNINACEVKLANIFSTTTATELYNILLAISNASNRNQVIKAATTSLFSHIIPIYKLRDLAVLEYLQQECFNYKNIWDHDGILAVIYQLAKNLNRENNLTPRELSNLFQLGELLHKQSIKTHNHATLLHWLKLKINNITIHKTKITPNVQLDGNDEELVRLDNDKAQIIITTQHKAKGLEYDILFCPYFATDDSVNASFGSNYKLPFFAAYRDSSNTPQAQLVNEKKLAECIVDNYNTENHRLNYVALTRAKSRLYIYLMAPLIRGKNYNSMTKVSKIHELFGYVKNNPTDTSHPLFNYPNFFVNKPNGTIIHDAIKNPETLPGVVIYQHSNLDNALDNTIDILVHQDTKQICTPTTHLDAKNNIQYLSSTSALTQPWKIQSYSSLTRIKNTTLTYEAINGGELIDSTNLTYRYAMLNQLQGAKFGTFFHALCEKYPLSEASTLATLQEYNISDDYKDEAILIINEVFNYGITTDGATLTSLRQSSYSELEFNLNISQNINLSNELVNLFNKYYGVAHPYTIAASKLPTISNGFLNGFIDVVFMHKNKYYVLDYKTNTLTDYTNNILMTENANHHYYLQYLLYLVALKRYLENRLQIDDATELIGGAIYYYVRGVFVEQNKNTTDDNNSYGVYTNINCQELVRDLDQLFQNNKPLD